MDIPQDQVQPQQSAKRLPVDAPVHEMSRDSEASLPVRLHLTAPQLRALYQIIQQDPNATCYQDQHEESYQKLIARDQDAPVEIQIINGIHDGLKVENDSLKNRIILAEHDNQKLREEIATLKGNNQNNAELNAALEGKQGDLLKVAGELRISNNKVCLLEIQNDELKRKLEERELEKKLQDKMIGKLEHEKNVFEYNLGISRLLFNNLRDENQELKKDCEEQKGEMMKHVNEKQEMNEQIEKLKDSVKTLGVEVSKKTSHIQRLREDKSKLLVLAEIHGQEASSKKKFPSSSYVKRSVIGVHRTNLTLLRLVGNVRREMSEVVESNQTIWKMYVRKVVELDYAKEKITSLEESAQVVEIEADAADGDDDSDGDPQIQT